MGPDSIPYTVWKDHAELLAPVLTKVWNLSLKTYTWPVSWKRSNINPIPKVDMMKENSDYRGINITPVIARAFKRTFLRLHVNNNIKRHLGSCQFAYREGGGCTDALVAVQHALNRLLDNPECKAVRLFAMDFVKAFDSVKHDLLSKKLRQIDLNPYVYNWYFSFLKDRQQRARVVINGCIGGWVQVNKGTTQGSVSCPHLFNIFLNDLKIHITIMGGLLKYADDSNIISLLWKDEDNSEEMVQQFLEWSRRNSMKSNPAKCKELSFRKKCCIGTFPLVFGIPQQSSIVILGVTFKEDSRFTIHVYEKLKKADRCLFIISSSNFPKINTERFKNSYINRLIFKYNLAL